MNQYRKLFCWLSLLLLPFCLGACGPSHYIAYNDRGMIFFLDYPNAKEVSFASSTDDFKVQPAHRDKQGRWFIDGMKREGFEYFYLVDGKFFVPDCRYRQQDDFGNLNCIYQP